MNLVVDTSAGFELVPETVCQSMLAKAPSGTEWWAPEHYYIEVAGAIWRAEHRRAIKSAQATAAFERLQRGRLPRFQVRPLLERAWSRRGHLTIADAVYVVLAEEIEATLITATSTCLDYPDTRYRQSHPESPLCRSPA